MTFTQATIPTKEVHLHNGITIYPLATLVSGDVKLEVFKDDTGYHVAEQNAYLEWVVDDDNMVFPEVEAAIEWLEQGGGMPI